MAPGDLERVALGVLPQGMEERAREPETTFSFREPDSNGKPARDPAYRLYRRPHRPKSSRISTLLFRLSQRPETPTVECGDGPWNGHYESGAATAVARRRSSRGRWQGYVEAVLLELLPLQAALARMHGFVMLLLLVAPMALAVFGDLLLYAAPCPRFIGGHLRAPGRGLCLNAAHGSNPPLFPWNSSFISSAFGSSFLAGMVWPSCRVVGQFRNRTPHRPPSCREWLALAVGKPGLLCRCRWYLPKGEDSWIVEYPS